MKRCNSSSLEGLNRLSQMRRKVSKVMHAQHAHLRVGGHAISHLRVEVDSHCWIRGHLSICWLSVDRLRITVVRLCILLV